MRISNDERPFPFEGSECKPNPLSSPTADGADYAVAFYHIIFADARATGVSKFVLARGCTALFHAQH